MTNTSTNLRRSLAPLNGAANVTRIPFVASAAVVSNGPTPVQGATPEAIAGVPPHADAARNSRQKELIGREAARLCSAGEAVMIDGGSTTLQMCRHLAGLQLQVLTNSLHVVNALLPQRGTRVLLPGGQVFPDQNVILSAAVDDDMPRFYAPKLFMGAAALGPDGLSQADFILVAAKRRLIDRAEKIVVLVDSSKFDGSSGQVVCGLEEIDVVVTDAGITPQNAEMLRRNRVKLIIATETA